MYMQNIPRRQVQQYILRERTRFSPAQHRFKTEICFTSPRPECCMLACLRLPNARLRADVVCECMCVCVYTSQCDKCIRFRCMCVSDGGAKHAT